MLGLGGTRDPSARPMHPPLLLVQCFFALNATTQTSQIKYAKYYVSDNSN